MKSYLKLYHTMGGCPCGLTNVRFRRLYYRYGGRGRQKFIPWGYECKYCGFIFPSQDMFMWPPGGNPIERLKKQVKWYEQQVKDKKLIQPELLEILDSLPQNTSN